MQQFQGPNTPRFPQLSGRPSGIEQIQRPVFQQQQNQRPTAEQFSSSTRVTLVNQSQKNTTVQPQTLVMTTENNASDHEIPDNVTAELEKLEQDSTMSELQGVSEILGSLQDDDDELLGGF